MVIFFHDSSLLFPEERVMIMGHKMLCPIILFELDIVTFRNDQKASACQYLSVFRGC